MRIAFFLPRALRLAMPPLGAMLLGLSACSKEDSGLIVVSVVGDRDDLKKPLQQLPDPAAKLLLESTAQGLVAFDARGDIVPGLAQRWIVEDDGRSYIFRLRRAFWADGSRVTATAVARMLMARITSLRQLDPDGPLDAVQAVVPMTGEVIEIRMVAARPYMLQMLAQPQMGILSRDGGTGPYRARRQGGALMLTPVDRSTGDDDAEEEPIPPSMLRVLRAERAALGIVRFREGRSALMLGGRFADVPLLVPAGIDRDAVRIDPVQGFEIPVCVPPLPRQRVEMADFGCRYARLRAAFQVWRVHFRASDLVWGRHPRLLWRRHKEYVYARPHFGNSDPDRSSDFSTSAMRNILWSFQFL